MNKDTISGLKGVGIFLFIILVLPASCMTTCHPAIGLFPESNFRLSEDSRLPKWFAIPDDYERKDLAVEIYYFGGPFKKDFKAILLGPGPEFKKIDRAIGSHHWHPATLKEKEAKGTWDFSPQFVIAEIDGFEEVIEHKEPGPVFSITDDPNLTKALTNR